MKKNRYLDKSRFPLINGGIDGTSVTKDATDEYYKGYWGLASETQERITQKDNPMKHFHIESLTKGLYSRYNGYKYKEDASGTIKEKATAALEMEASDMDNDKLLEKYMDAINQDRRDMERRLTDDMCQSEARNEDRFSRLETYFGKLGEKIDEHKRFLWGILLTAILGIAGIVVTMVWAIVQVISSI